MKILYKDESYRIVGACFNYLKAKEMSLGLLVNFGHYPNLEYQRIVK